MFYYIKPTFYYILNIKMTSQSLSNFCIELPAAGENTSTSKITSIAAFIVLQSWYNVTIVATSKLRRATKIVLLPGVPTCRATSFECLGYIHLSLLQSTTYPSMTSRPYSLSYFEHSSNWYFSIHSL